MRCDSEPGSNFSLALKLPDQYQYVTVKLQVAAPSGAGGWWLSTVAECNERALMV